MEGPMQVSLENSAKKRTKKACDLEQAYKLPELLFSHY